MYYNHVCTLPDQEVKKHKFSQKFFDLTQISPKHPKTKAYFRSIASIQREKKRHASLKNKWIIHPLSMFSIYWELWMMFVVYVGLYITPVNLIILRVTYRSSDPIDIYTVLIFMEIFSDFVSILDICLCLSTGVCNPKKFEILLQRKEIIRHHVKQTRFYVLSLCSVPIYLINQTVVRFNPPFGYSTTARSIELFGAFKTLRVFKFLECYDSTTERFQHHHYTRIAIKYLVVIPAMIHSLAGYYICVLQTIPLFSHFTEYVGPSLHVRFILEFHYSTIYYKAFETVTSYLLGISNTTAFRDNESMNSESLRGLLLFLLIATIGYFCVNILFVQILEMLLSMNASSTKYNEIMAQLKRYIVHKDLPNSIHSRILSYYDYRFQKTYFRESSILAMLSETLRREINLHFCRKLIESVPLLRELPSEIIAEVVGNLNHEVFLYNDIIVKAGTVGDCMYFIANGSVAVSTPTGKEICHLQDGAYFGEIALIAKDQKRVANVVAIEICEIYRLDRKNFRMCFPANSMFYKKIEQVARERMEKTVLLEQLHKKYVLERSTKRSATFRKVSVTRDAT